MSGTMITITLLNSLKKVSGCITITYVSREIFMRQRNSREKIMRREYFESRLKVEICSYFFKFVPKKLPFRYFVMLTQCAYLAHLSEFVHINSTNVCTFYPHSAVHVQQTAVCTQSCYTLCAHTLPQWREHQLTCVTQQSRLPLNLSLSTSQQSPSCSQ